ncbi:hypothetical protein LTR56_011062 [Elasticomyces elasticus]|nr:hypothetical protein LTR56_011062 [Elasticomyces elasticus]
MDRPGLASHDVCDADSDALTHWLGVCTVAPPLVNCVHPRRAPAHSSVSLLHIPRNLGSPTGLSDSCSSNDSTRPLTLQGLDKVARPNLHAVAREGSGESSNAEQWFEQSNNAVREYADHNSPFFMRHNSSSETSPNGNQAFGGVTGSRPNLMRLGTDGSSTSDFRGVIDDLTIENKKLKRKLKRYESLHDSHLKDEKLFEVRIHGLPADKKRELEETLRKFAVSIGQKPSNEFPSDGYQTLLPKLRAHKTANSQANDSAYASMSMSASGQGGSSASSSKSQAFHPSAASRRQNIQSYLHHIPEGLLPLHNPVNMTERAKKKLVVQRLEQLFAGRGAGESGHQQPIQQQEVSQLAAHADRSELEAQGQRARKEGIREAHIVAHDSNDSKHDSDEAVVGHKVSGHISPVQPDSATRSPSQSLVEQRPTRPLDLDPQRAQYPSENIAYFRHLGFSPSNTESGKPLEEGHGWIYLNLLMNMAQLHTINVTVDFVQTALAEHSDRFEISPDGRKVRWNGSRSTSQVSKDNDFAGARSPHKRRKLSHAHTQRQPHTGGKADRAVGPHTVLDQRRYAYTPMFSHRGTDGDSSDSSSDEDEDTASSVPAPLAAGDASGMTGSGVRAIRSLRKKDDGPIIFYNNTRFCTDLSAEHNSGKIQNPPPYAKFAARPLGAPQATAAVNVEARGPMDVAVKLPDATNLDEGEGSSSALIFPDNSPAETQCENLPLCKAFDLPVSGIGGVWPADNFEISVQTRYAHAKQAAQPHGRKVHTDKALPPRLEHILRERQAQQSAVVAVREQIVGTRRRQLTPSKLPPALGFMPFDDGMQEDNESCVDDGLSMSPGSPGTFTRSPAPLPMNLPSAESDEDDEDDDDDSSAAESDSSLDFLADARKADPDSIRAQEREYNIFMAERLAEEIPTGSSAATAGGGSGFASPAKGVAHAEYERAKQAARDARITRSQLRRPASSGSLQFDGMDRGSGHGSDDAQTSDSES